MNKSKKNKVPLSKSLLLGLTERQHDFLKTTSMSTKIPSVVILRNFVNCLSDLNKDEVTVICQDSNKSNIIKKYKDICKLDDDNAIVLSNKTLSVLKKTAENNNMNICKLIDTIALLIDGLSDLSLISYDKETLRIINNTHDLKLGDIQTVSKCSININYDKERDSNNKVKTEMDMKYKL